VTADTGICRDCPRIAPTPCAEIRANGRTPPEASWSAQSSQALTVVRQGVITRWRCGGRRRAFEARPHRRAHRDRPPPVGVHRRRRWVGYRPHRSVTFCTGADSFSARHHFEDRRSHRQSGDDRILCQRQSRTGPRSRRRCAGDRHLTISGATMSRVASGVSIRSPLTRMTASHACRVDSAVYLATSGTFSASGGGSWSPAASAGSAVTAE
jgi:hypothetical protein